MSMDLSQQRSSMNSLPELPLMLVKALPTISRKGAQQDEIEDLERTYSCAPIKPSHLEEYKSMFPGFVSEVPLTYFYLVAQRAHLALMLDDKFPWPILGMVHVANEMELHETVQVHKPFVLHVCIEFPPRAGARKRVRPQYIVKFYQDEKCVVTCKSSYQVGGGQKSKSRTRAEKVEQDGWSVISEWHLKSDLGRKYARLSGDYNPIHLHRWLSRWFGFARPIIHGMYSVARMQASIESSLQQEVTQLQIGFKRPVILPMELKCSAHSANVRVTDAKQEKVFVEGVYATGDSE
ncbi:MULTISPECIES: MaoC/PaaZ C-terminal domain-containing protein [Gammaproteobacteria]|uniref:MaoC/PaaZ C-terminal domain-containing protein n=1 Tax=Gammaproteobacteria TaxID=1236 RepID=UPI000DCF92F1|nr:MULTISPECIES: MaoC/PaaZ C-terminal domain-containing protein [Gammaproteobacteria]RTE87237.1 acyl dehydratase [Aliidiomarina sp. B3213]TCZ92976.1 acyl dehydratase [Lysobacter sp. N42]